MARKQVDYSPPPLLLHVGDCLSGEPDRADKVLLQRRHYSLVVKLRRAARRPFPNVVHEDTDVAEPVDSVPHHTTTVPGCGKVRGNGEYVVLRTDAGQLDFGAAKLSFGTGRNGHTCTLLGKSQSDGLTDTPAGTSDNGNPVPQPQIHSAHIPPCFIIEKPPTAGNGLDDRPFLETAYISL